MSGWRHLRTTAVPEALLDAAAGLLLAAGSGAEARAIASGSLAGSVIG